MLTMNLIYLPRGRPLRLTPQSQSSSPIQARVEANSEHPTSSSGKKTSVANRFPSFTSFMQILLQNPIITNSPGTAPWSSVTMDGVHFLAFRSHRGGGGDGGVLFLQNPVARVLSRGPRGEWRAECGEENHTGWTAGPLRF